MTLVPALARDGAAHVTMLQRSPTYVLSVPARDAVKGRLTRLVGEERSFVATRWKNIAMQSALYRASRRRPDLVRRLVRRTNVAQLPPGYAVDTHFNPSYDPWDQRMCLVPDGDLFRAISDGRADVVTGRIATFTETGLELESGERLEADVVVTATGLNLQVFGGAELSVDGELVEPSRTMAYRAMMLSGVPNFAFTIGYTNASWTLKADLVGGVRRPAAGAAAVDRHPVGRPGARPGRRGGAADGLRRRLRAAGGPHASPAGHAGPVVAQAELPPRRPDHPAGAPRRRRAALVLSAFWWKRSHIVGTRSAATVDRRM